MYGKIHLIFFAILWEGGRGGYDCKYYSQQYELFLVLSLQIYF